MNARAGVQSIGAKHAQHRAEKQHATDDQHNTHAKDDHLSPASASVAGTQDSQHTAFLKAYDRRGTDGSGAGKEAQPVGSVQEGNSYLADNGIRSKGAGARNRAGPPDHPRSTEAPTHLPTSSTFGASAPHHLSGALSQPDPGHAAAMGSYPSPPQEVPREGVQKAAQNALQVAPQKVPQKAPPKAPQKAPPKAPQKAPPKAPQEAPQEAPQRASQKASQKAPLRAFKEATQTAPQRTSQEATLKAPQRTYQEGAQNKSSQEAPRSNAVHADGDTRSPPTRRTLASRLQKLKRSVPLLEQRRNVVSDHDQTRQAKKRSEPEKERAESRGVVTARRPATAPSPAEGSHQFSPLAGRGRSTERNRSGRASAHHKNQGKFSFETARIRANKLLHVDVPRMRDAWTAMTRAAKARFPETDAYRRVIFGISACAALIFLAVSCSELECTSRSSKAEACHFFEMPEQQRKVLSRASEKLEEMVSRMASTHKAKPGVAWRKHAAHIINLTQQVRSEKRANAIAPYLLAVFEVSSPLLRRPIPMIDAFLQTANRSKSPSSSRFQDELKSFFHAVRLFTKSVKASYVHKAMLHGSLISPARSQSLAPFANEIEVLHCSHGELHGIIDACAMTQHVLLDQRVYLFVLFGKAVERVKLHAQALWKQCMMDDNCRQKVACAHPAASKESPRTRSSPQHGSMERRKKSGGSPERR